MTVGKSPPPAILIVEDDQLLMSFAVDIVEEAGFAAIEAGNADEAVAVLESRSDIALVLTDVNMPGSMDGLKLAHAIRDRWPRIKIIVVSGEVRPSENDLPLNSLFLGKPFLAATMISGIHSLIGA
jgi:CheY-like chemotaxis protein